MPTFSPRSEAQLLTCDPRIQRVMREVVKFRDCAITVGYRGQEEQDAAHAAGLSKLRWPNSKHNTKPSKAVDVAPFPIDWNDRERFVLFAGFVLGIATSMGIDLRWGGDFNDNGKTSDETFSDLVHFELKGA